MGYKLLLADDSITIQKVVELVLAEEDFEIKSVSNGEDALNLLVSFKPDIVLADIEMPKVNGYNLCEKIKKNPATSQVPVILLAGAFEPIDEELAREVGADDSVIKPFESQELISKINAALTMVSADAEQDEPYMEDNLNEDFLGAVEETDVFSAAGTSGLEEVEAVDVEALEEDLWSMEEIPETAVGETKEALAENEMSDFGGDDAIGAMKEPSPSEHVLEKMASKESFSTPVSKAPVDFEADMPSKEEFLRIFEAVVEREAVNVLSGLDLKEALLSSLLPVMKDSIEKVLWEIAPELAEKVMKEMLSSSVSTLTKEVEKVIWETVPDLASTLIAREIEKIKTEF
jgi:DNA-binding response OmpR family regulator